LVWRGGWAASGRAGTGAEKADMGRPDESIGGGFDLKISAMR
jgi:hypothetical protein